MRKSTRFLILTLPLCFVIHLFYTPQALSQNANNSKFSLDKITFDLKKSGEASVQAGSVGGQSKHGSQWGRLQLEYTSNVDWSDEVQVKIWVLLFNREGKKEKKSIQDQITVLTETSTYLNVPEGKGNRSVFFIHPDTLNRFGEVKEIHTELWRKGVLEGKLDQIISKKSIKKLNLKDWWTRFQPLNGQLFQPIYTPFVVESDNPTSAVKLS